jgi:hypothetical protein
VGSTSAARLEAQDLVDACTVSADATMNASRYLARDLLGVFFTAMLST